jgi:CubicO group peptidase (beta-lactamase class C family)
MRVSPERIVEPALGVSTSNWIAPPYNRWGFRNVDKLARTETIPRGGGPVRELPAAPGDLDGLTIRHRGMELTLDEWLEQTWTDGLLVLQDGTVVYERYFAGMEPGDRHLLMSVSKSLTSTLCGVLVGQGLLSPDDRLTGHLVELRGTAWEDCRVQDLLDMRAGVRWDLYVDEFTILDVSDYRTHVREGIAQSTRAWIESIELGRRHGKDFRYISLATDVLGLVLERAGGAPFAELFSREVWSKLGPEQDAYILIDGEGLAVVEGGICTTLRDLARFGQMCLLEGDGIVPAEWLGRLRRPDSELITAFHDAFPPDPAWPEAFYHDCWWIWDAAQGIYRGSGMNGQAIVVHHPSRTVVAKFSSQPVWGDKAMSALQATGLAAIADALIE